MGSRGLMWAATGCFSIGIASGILIDEGLAFAGISALLVVAAAALFGLALLARGREPRGMPTDIASWAWFVLGTDPPSDPTDKRRSLVFARDIQLWNLLLLTPFAAAFCVVYASDTVIYVVVAVIAVGLSLVNLAWIQVRIARERPR